MINFWESVIRYQHYSMAAVLGFIHNLLLTFGYAGTYQHGTVFSLFKATLLLFTKPVCIFTVAYYWQASLL